MDSLKEDQREFVKNKKLISKTQKIFKSERHNVFTEKINMISVSSNNEKKSDQLVPYRTSKDLICKKEKIKRNKIIKQYNNV